MRPDGPAGTANHWVVIPLVFCQNRNLIFNPDDAIEGRQRS
ncbi:MAG: hypothetical protein ACOYOF_13630 [Verrucomicrobiaceae bacterium]